MCECVSVSVWVCRKIREFKGREAMPFSPPFDARFSLLKKIIFSSFTHNPQSLPRWCASSCLGSGRPTASAACTAVPCCGKRWAGTTATVPARSPHASLRISRRFRTPSVTKYGVEERSMRARAGKEKKRRGGEKAKRFSLFIPVVL